MKNENEADDKAPHLLPTIMQMGVSFTWRALPDYEPDRYLKNSAVLLWLNLLSKVTYKKLI